MDHHGSIRRGDDPRGWLNRRCWSKAGFFQTDNALDSVPVRLGQHDLWFLCSNPLRRRNRIGTDKHVSAVGRCFVLAPVGNPAIEKNLARTWRQLSWDVDGVRVEHRCRPDAIQFFFAADRHSDGHLGGDVERSGAHQFASGQAFGHPFSRGAFFWRCNSLQSRGLVNGARRDANPGGRLRQHRKTHWHWTSSDGWATVFDESVFDWVASTGKRRGALPSCGGSTVQVVYGAADSNPW